MQLLNWSTRPRKLPTWWARFTASYPLVPNLVAVAGLAWLCFALARNVANAERHNHGEWVEVLRVVSGSQLLVDDAISLRNIYHQTIPDEVRVLFANLYGNLTLYLVLPFILFLELLFPSNPSQPLIGKGFLQDAFWYIANTPITILVLFPFINFMRGLFEQHMGILIIAPASAWPAYLQVTAAMLFSEFLMWVNHFVRHKLRPLWHFHAVHHSQKELNAFTDDRGHFVDLFVSSLLTYIPFFIFQVSNLYVISVIAIYMPMHNRFIHANLKINLGWLGYIFTSPQFHRVHHSVDPAHADQNFGVMCSTFDYLFGTAARSRFIYPETGIADPQFPNEDKVQLRQLPANWLTQTAYPFIRLFRRRPSSAQPGTLRVRIIPRRKKAYNSGNAGNSRKQPLGL